MEKQDVTVTTTVTRRRKLYTVVVSETGVTVDKMDYPTIVSALIRSRYSDDDMTAVINNYLLSPDDDVAKSEFGAMQEWRKHAKEVAKAAVEEYGRLYPDV